MRAASALCTAGYFGAAAVLAVSPSLLEKRLFGLDPAVQASTTTTAAVADKTNVVQQATSTAPAATIVAQKPVANNFWKNFKARGVNLGNWLILEEWMDPMFYRNGSSTGTDEWSFCETLGPDGCDTVLSQYWNDWVVRDDIVQLADDGFNLLRVPVGHWALVPTTTDEPYIHSTQMQQVERVMQYANDLGLHVILDLHGLPGSQNGKDHSGHQGPIGWFNSANQKRSLDVVTAAMNFISSSPNKGVIAAVEICNEPNVTLSSNRKTYEKYIKDATKVIHKINSSMPVMFHDGFLGASAWSKLTKNAKDNYVIDIHKYYTDSTDNSVNALSAACALATSQSTSKPDTPVFVGEFSLSIGGAFLDTDAWRRSFFETQVREYSGSHLAGSAFWGLKALNSDGVTQNNGWSIQALASSGIVSSSTWDVQNALVCPVK